MTFYTKERKYKNISIWGGYSVLGKFKNGILEVDENSKNETDKKLLKKLKTLDFVFCDELEEHSKNESKEGAKSVKR